MGFLVWMLLGVVLVPASLFMMLQRLQQRRDIVRISGGMSVVPRDAVRPSNPFAAVSIRPAPGSPCDAVLQMGGHRYLAVRAPSLPVPGCDSGKCNCRYVRYADRRTLDDDRRDSFAYYGGIMPSTRAERRSRRSDRRRGSSRGPSQ